MSQATDEATLIAAWHLRDVARTTLRTDIATLRQDVADRPLLGRARDMAISTALDTAESGIDLALENRGVLALTGTALAGWLFRKPLGTLAHRGLVKAERWLQQYRR